ncbi:MAG TPA: 50S ribosomal protein L3 N(5)-glutamine methyltransferase [Usitatibacter sp.]|nr:50S ribosomal protein L3 N(5)-glutamine methyltransferase [Usitatibacter sp.]
MARTVRALLDYGVDLFEKSGISYGHGTTNALDEAAWLVLRALDLPPHDPNPHLDEVLSPARYEAAKSLLERRVATRKPAAYLLHEAWLGPHRFYVDERVIVPRSFIAELLLDPARAPLAGRSPRAILDLCTGSGCLAILAALRFPQARVDAADLSQDALEVAARNVADYGLGERIRLVKSDLFTALRGRTYDLIVSNPPYVKAASMRSLPDEYRKEPRLALASGADGLEHARAILAGARGHLRPGGLLLVEIGHNRKALERAFPGLAFEWPKTSAGKGFVFAIPAARLP